MKKFKTLVVCAGLLIVNAVTALGMAAPLADDEPVRLIHKIKAPSLSQIGHLDLDAKRNRLLIPVAGSNSLEIIELGSGKNLPPITSLGAPKDVLYLSEFDSIVVSSGGHGKLFFFDAETFKPTGSVALDRNCNYLRYDPKTHEIYVTNGDGIITVVDAESRKVLRKFELGDPTGSFSLEANGDRLFVNIPSKATVVVLNRRTGEELARWHIEDSVAANNVVMEFDEAKQRLFIACRKPPRFLVMDAKNGKAAAVLPMIGDCEDLTYDARTERIYATCGVGTIDVFNEPTPGTFRLESRIPTATGGRTSVFVPERRHLYVPVPASRGASSYIHVYETAPFGEPVPNPTEPVANNPPANETSPETRPE
jgi:hypothetical protein